MKRRMGIATVVFISCVAGIVVIALSLGYTAYLHERGEYRVEMARMDSTHPGADRTFLREEYSSTIHREMAVFLVTIGGALLLAVGISYLLSRIVRREFTVFGGLLEKPYRVEEIARVLDEVLGSSEAGGTGG